MMPGLYKFQNIRADIVGVFTNCVPTDAYRGAGRPEATHGIERMVDMLAAELKMDPGRAPPEEFRRQRRIPLRHRHRPQLRQRQLRRAAGEGARHRELHKLRDEQAQARADRAADGHRHLHLWRNLRHGPVARHARRRLGKRHGQDRAVRQSHGHDRHTRRTARAKRPLSRRLPPTSWASASTTCWCCTATPPSCNTASEPSAAAARPSADRRSTTRFQDLKEKIKKFGAMLLDSDDVTFANGACT